MAKDSRVEAVIPHWSPRAAIHKELRNQALADGYQTADWMATQLGVAKR